jgi:hypothetical protein
LSRKIRILLFNQRLLKGLVIKDEDGFVALADFHGFKVRVPANGRTQRPISFISPGEIGLAMLAVAEQAIGLTSEGLIDATAKALGYARKGDRMIACMNDALERIVTQGKVKLVNGKVRVIGGENLG